VEEDDYLVDNTGETALFKIITAHTTRLAADPDSGALVHTPEGSGIPVVGRRMNNRVALLARTDGGLISNLGTVPGEVVQAYPILLDTGPDGTVIRLPGGRFLTAIPGGEVSLNRQSPGGWEAFQLEPVQETSPVFAPLGHPDSIESRCEDPEINPAILTVLLAGLPSQQRQQLMPMVIRRTDYERVFPMLRAVLSSGAERSAWNTQSRLRDGIAAHGWTIGDHTYGDPTIVDGQYGSLQIGRYCSIAGQVRIVVANHAIDTLTTYPFSALSEFWPSASLDTRDHSGTGVVIGHSVWIGAGATILPGARIGDGAIIGAMAVVAGTVPPYSVVVGNPARVTRQRFDATAIERLLAIRWWDWPDHEVDRVVTLLLTNDVAGFLAHAEARH
jgi:virginiamycin A acetyltransferase